MPHPFSDDVPQLLIEHREHLAGSAISTELILERGYKSILGASGLKDLGFSKVQRRRTGILIPLHSVEGGVFGYQYKPDNPRTNNRDKPIKYENPIGSHIRIDVPPRCREQLGNPKTPLFITEGVKKVDALATAGVCAIGLTGVWGFKGKNHFGGTSISADFDYISFKDRIVYIVFDSDSATNPHVKQAMIRLSEHLTRKGAKVRRLALPPGPEGEKTGADDFIVRGGTISEMMAMEEMDEQSLKEASKFLTENVYLIEYGVLCWKRPVKEGSVTVPMCNFNCHIHQHVIKDDGQNKTDYFRIAGTTMHGDSLPLIDVKTEQFGSMKWPLEKWGLQAIIEPGQNIKDRLQHAILLQSQEAEIKPVYTHTGWREYEDEHIFLTSSGSIGIEDQYDVNVELEKPLQKYILLPPEGDPIESFNISQDFLLIGQEVVTLPIWTAMYLAPLTEFIDTAFTMWYVAPSGSFKSVMTALALNHFGAFDHLTLPASWTSSENDLETLLYLGKDIPFVIDDWYPGEDAAESRRLAQKAGRIIRSQGNRQGRGRRNADMSARTVFYPRGLLISSGEQMPGGHSQTSRVITVEMEKGDIYRDMLTEAQKKGRFYNMAMAHYIRWIAANWNDLAKDLPKYWEDQREHFYNDRNHARLAGDLASLCTGLHAVGRFGMEIGAITEKQAAAMASDGRDIFGDMVSSQSERVEGQRPSLRFIAAMSTLIRQGRAVFSNVEDETPRIPAPGTFNVGWQDLNGTYFLDPESSFSAVYQYYNQTGQPFTFKEDAVWKDLVRQGYSKASPDGRSKITKRIQGKPIRIIEVKKDIFA